MAEPDLFNQTRLAPITFAAPVTSLQMLAAAAVGGSGGGADYELPFAIEDQKQDQWCWAAVTVSVSRFYSTASLWTQCSLATQELATELGDPDCCVNCATCNQSWFLDSSLKRTGNLSLFVNGVLSSQYIVAELSGNRPICCRVAWNPASGHFVAISGYQNDGIKEMITVYDPNGAQRHYIGLEEFSQAYEGTGTWSHSYYTQA